MSRANKNGTWSPVLGQTNNSHKPLSLWWDPTKIYPEGCLLNPAPTKEWQSLSKNCIRVPELKAVQRIKRVRKHGEGNGSVTRDVVDMGQTRRKFHRQGQAHHPQISKGIDMSVSEIEPASSRPPFHHRVHYEKFDTAYTIRVPVLECTMR